MRKKNVYNKKRNLFSGLSEKLIQFNDVSSKPIFIQRKFQGYRTAMVAFAIFGIVGAILTKSAPILILGLFLAAIIAALCKIQAKNIDENGYELWHFEVLEHTRLTILNRRPTGFYAEALDGPYKGKTCHLSVSGQNFIPPEGRAIEVCVPGNTEANLISDIYYIPQYYGMDLVRDE